MRIQCSLLCIFPIPHIVRIVAVYCACFDSPCRSRSMECNIVPAIYVINRIPTTLLGSHAAAAAINVDQISCSKRNTSEFVFEMV